MPIGSFLKPGVGKIILFLILMGGINYYVISTGLRPDIRYLAGVPFGFWPVGFAFIRNPPQVNFSLPNFIVNMLFWYVISAAIMSMFAKKEK